MEELVDINKYDYKLKDLKENVSNSEKIDNDEESLSSDTKKLKSRNKFRKYIILILSCVILFITYHLLLQYKENIFNQVFIKSKNLLNYQQNLNGSTKELEQVEYQKALLKKELGQYKEKYVEYNQEYQKLKKEYDKIVEYSDELYRIGNEFREKYNKYKKDFEKISNIFHSFFVAN